MSGHSKWATIKHKKGALDAKRGKIFTRLIKEISIAARSGGDPDKNPRLRTAVAAAKAENMPSDNIKRAIQRGTGELPGVNYEEFTLEGYGPGGAAVLVELSTDNRNRTVSEIRHAFGKNGGNMAEAGAVAWMFHKKGDIMVPKSAAKEDHLMGLVLENGDLDLDVRVRRRVGVGDRLEVGLAGIAGRDVPPVDRHGCARGGGGGRGRALGGAAGRRG